MNKVTFILIILACLVLDLTAQDASYAPMFGKTSSGWYQYIDLGEAGGKTTLKMYASGDTTTNNGKKYIRLMNDWYFASDDTTYTQVIGFFREDTAKRIVYGLNVGNELDPENVYYDYSKNEGDTLKLGVNLVLLVDSINTTAVVCGDTIETGSRVFHLTNLNDGSNITWIEGVGSISGFQANYYGFNCETLDEGLICKMTDDVIVYHFNQFEGFEECAFQVGTSNLQKPEELALRLYPNPAHSELRIAGNPDDLGNARFRIFNLTGKMLKSGFLDYSRETSLDISNLRGGAYIIEIYNSDKNLLTNKKFVVAR